MWVLCFSCGVAARGMVPPKKEPADDFRARIKSRQLHKQGTRYIDLNHKSKLKKTEQLTQWEDKNPLPFSPAMTNEQHFPLQFLYDTVCTCAFPFVIASFKANLRTQHSKQATTKTHLFFDLNLPGLFLNFVESSGLELNDKVRKTALNKGV